MDDLKSAIKKMLLITGLILLCIGIVFFGAGMVGGLSNGLSDKEEDTDYDIEMSFYLDASVKGEYGQVKTYNKGTECEDSYYAFYVPAGKYIVTNKTDRGPWIQLNVYSNETHIVDGWEEIVDGKVYKIERDESIIITVREGYHIHIDEPAYVKMEKIKE